MFLIDTHAHLDEQSFEAEFDEMLHRAHAAHVGGMVSIGITLDSCRRVLQLAQTHPSIRAAVGIHPNYVAQAAFEDWDRVCELAKHPLVVAVGETGLDRYWDHTPLELQVDYFERHLALSQSTGKPFGLLNLGPKLRLGTAYPRSSASPRAITHPLAKPSWSCQFVCSRINDTLTGVLAT